VDDDSDEDDGRKKRDEGEDRHFVSFSNLSTLSSFARRADSSRISAFVRTVGSIVRRRLTSTIRWRTGVRSPPSLLFLPPSTFSLTHLSSSCRFSTPEYDLHEFLKHHIDRLDDESEDEEIEADNSRRFVPIEALADPHRPSKSNGNGIIEYFDKKGFMAEVSLSSRLCSLPYLSGCSTELCSPSSPLLFLLSQEYQKYLDLEDAQADMYKRGEEDD